MRISALAAVAAVFVLFAFAALAHDEGLEPSVQSPAAVTSSRAATSAPAIPQEMENSASGSIVPRPDASAPAPETSAPGITAPAPAEIPAPQSAQENADAGLGVYALLATALAAVLGGYGVYKLKTQKRNQNRDEKDNSSCLNIKKLMEKKLAEVTDVKGQLERKAKEKVRETLRGTIDSTATGEILALAERAEKEYARLRQLYQECIAERDMKKRIFIIHMWDSNPDDGWYPWLKNELENKGYQVQVPVMPEPADPKIGAWVSHLTKVVGDVDENTFFVGHSVGCQTILRYLEGLPTDKKAGGAVFVAGWLKLVNLETKEEKEIAKPWLETPINFDKVKQHTSKFAAIFSDNDLWVSLDNKDLFVQKLGAKAIVENRKGHFSGSDGVTELPIALEALMSF